MYNHCMQEVPKLKVLVCQIRFGDAPSYPQIMQFTAYIATHSLLIGRFTYFRGSSATPPPQLKMKV